MLAGLAPLALAARQVPFPPDAALTDPLTLTPAFWVQASDLSTIFEDDGGVTPGAEDQVVGKWADKSGNARHALQATTDAKPILRLDEGGYNVRTDGIDDFLAAAYVQSAYPLTIAAALRIDTFGSQVGICSVNVNTGSWKQLTMTGTTIIQAQDRNATPLHINAHNVATGRRVAIAEFDTATAGITVNRDTTDTVVNTNAFGTSANIYLGKTRSTGLLAAVSIYELMIFPRILTTAEKNLLIPYLGLAAGLSLK